jgi:decaprenylphospho-beta-D-ribofuranose 2-oxidase
VSVAPATERTLFSGWGRTAPSAARRVEPGGVDDIEELLAGARGPVIPRGLGRSYGDAAQSAGGTVVDMCRFDALGEVDAATGLVEVGAGVVLDELMRRLVPAGWFVPVTPGTRQVTVGGAIAADIHGKNHHRDGSFCRHVVQCTIVTPKGVVDVAPDGTAASTELFWATAGGMGLTGVVTRARVQMVPVESSWVLVDTERYDDLSSVMAAMEKSDEAFRYSVAWVDCMVARGRAVLTRGDHALTSSAPAQRSDPALPERARLRVPFVAPRGLLNARSVRAFNEVWFRKAPRRQLGAPHSLASFFHPLDGVADWNRLYGPAGFVQYQFVVGPDRGDVVETAVARIAESGVPAFLAVLKRFGPGDPGPLSFPMPGWTLALDFPVGPPALPSLLRGLDAVVADAGGRVYLAKDARLAPELFRAMYPRLDEFTAVRDRVDPERVLRSDLSQRLGMEGAARA